MQVPGMKGARGFAWGAGSISFRCFAQDMHSPGCSPGAPSLNLSVLLHQEPLLPCLPQYISSVPCPAWEGTRGGAGAPGQG